MVNPALLFGAQLAAGAVARRAAATAGAGLVGQQVAKQAAKAGTQTFIEESQFDEPGDVPGASEARDLAGFVL